MEAYDVECCAGEIRNSAEKIITFIQNKAKKLEAHQAERKVFSLILEIGLTAMKLYFAERGTGDVGAKITEIGGRVLRRSKGLFKCAYFSIFGKFEVPRTRYRTRLKDSIFPLDRKANLPERCYSYFLQEICNRLEVDQTYRESSNFLKDYFELQASESVLINLAQDAASDYDAYYEARKVPASETESEIQVVSFDGKGIPMIKKEAAKLKSRLGKGEKRQKKKEALVGVSYTVGQNVRLAEDIAESLIYPEVARRRREEQKEKNEAPPRAMNIRRYASLELPKREVFKVLKNDVERRDPNHKRPLAVLLDGAKSLRSLGGEFFGAWFSVVFILDIIHVTEYLWEVANVLFGEASKEGRHWVFLKLTEILRGRVGYVIGSLRQIRTKRKPLKKSAFKALNKAITYFENHRDMMQYHLYLAAGMPIATSLVEASCGLVKLRMEGAGKRWGIPGAEAILSLLSLKTSNNNDLIDFEKFRAKKEKERLYGKRPKYRRIQDDKIAA